MSNLKVVVVGAGRAGADFHVPSFATQLETSVVAVVDPDLTRAREVAARNEVASAFGTLGEALSADRPDVVSVCSPPQFHLEQVREAMAAGCHVLLEKPMAMGVVDAEQMGEAQRKAGVKFCVVHNQKYLPTVEQAIGAIRRGEIGKVMHVGRCWMQNGAEDRMINNPDCWCHELPGGRWTETIPHDIYITYQVLGEMTLAHVEARKCSPRWPWLPADEVEVVLRHRGGYVTLRYSSQVDTRLYKHMFIYGSRGVFFVDDAMACRLPFPAPPPNLPPVQTFTTASHLKQGVKGVIRGGVRRIGGYLRKAPPAPAMSPASVPAATIRPKSQSVTHERVIREFVNHVRYDLPVPTTWDEALFTMRLADEIGRAIVRQVKSV